MRAKTTRMLVAMGLAGAHPAFAGAQVVQQKLQHEVRLDGLFAQSGAVHAGYGFSVPAGLYVRPGVVLGIGAGRHGVEGRSDLIARFSFDPFRQSRWAPYAGAGVSGRYRSERDGGARTYILLFFGLEGPVPFGERAGWVPALEVGLGGGARVGVILRRGITARR